MLSLVLRANPLRLLAPRWSPVAPPEGNGHRDKEDVTSGRAVKYAVETAEQAADDERERTAAAMIAIVGLSTLQLDELLDRLVKNIVQANEADVGAILLVHDDGETLRPGVYLGISEEDTRGLTIPFGQGFAGRVARERRPLIVEDAANDPTIINPGFRREGVRALAGVPLLIGEQLVGVVHVGRKSYRPFTAPEVRRLEVMAAQAALAVQHAILHERLLAVNAELVGANQKLQTVVQTMPAGVAILEAPSGRVVAVNRTAEIIWGRQASQTQMERLHYALYQPNGEPYPWEDLPMARSLTQGEVILGREMLMRRPDGKEFVVLVSSAPLRAADGTIEGAVAVFQDMSGMELERLKDEFVTVTTHELFTPLTIIKGTAQLIARKIEQGDLEGLAGPLTAIDGQANWMTHLLQKMTDAAELQLGPLSLRQGIADLATIVEKVVRRFQATTERHEIVFHIEDGPPLHGYWDRERVERSLANLLENAIEYSPNGGRIEVSVSRSPLRNPLDPNSAEEGREWALVRVTDQGIGISKEDQAHLFTRFYRSGPIRYQETPGLGLGLYVANRFISAHGGQICVESEPGKGSTFYFSLPLCADSADDETETDKQAAA